MDDYDVTRETEKVERMGPFTCDGREENGEEAKEDVAGAHSSKTK